MSIILSTDLSEGVNFVQEWLEFNNINFQSKQFWDETSSLHTVPTDVDNSIIVANYQFFLDCLSSEVSTNQLMTFFSKKNQMWLIGMDSALKLVNLNKGAKNNILELDKKLPGPQILYFLDAAITDHGWIKQLQNIKCQALDQNFFFGRPRVQARSSIKTQPRYDFLLTMIRKKNRHHRDVLWKQLNLNPEIMQRGIFSYNKDVQDKVERRKNWLGNLPSQHGWDDGHASMDLYLDCCVEIVPETCYRDLYFFTEKTCKPIATRTPFLMVSTMGYLGYLRDLGFKTFDSLIDEKYDVQHRVEDRIRLMIGALEHIARNGAFEFYQACEPILDHNFSRLCEISGNWQHQFDQLMWQSLDHSESMRQ